MGPGISFSAPDTQVPRPSVSESHPKVCFSPRSGVGERTGVGDLLILRQPSLLGDKECWPGGWLVPWSEMDNGPGLSARPWPCPFTSGAQFKLDNASSGQFPSPTVTTHLKGQSLLSGASAGSEFNLLHQVCRTSRAFHSAPLRVYLRKRKERSGGREGEDGEESKGLWRFSFLRVVLSKRLKLECKGRGTGDG